ncbi:uncharacterized protein LAESUDRAFT_647665 [Laetiporus sulphureus 93-53]|uniref:HNH nuclease domain-containing protein n=1 Tax=Laetiporus sulphureus 93-53 TaxID=1314785 RepID=A0A165FGK4_9APHY|nr:uncharacterized protein LAESUDRAFT_647665 [Laetiporus sulphureus 93-53]KZT08938.1 hypothetical protein LAESUDRAFT_647665 [Laetiporus sulphureus 93-53]
MSGTRKPTKLDAKKFNCHDPHIVSIYTVFFEVQDELARKVTAELPTSDRTSLELVRLFGHLLAEAPTCTAQYNLAREILSAPSKPGKLKIGAQVLAAVGDKHYKVFSYVSVRNLQLTSVGLFFPPHNYAVRRNRGPTPNPSNHSSRPSYDRKKEEILPLLNPNKLDHRGAKTAALLRDDDRCIVTRKFDSTIFEQSSDEFQAKLLAAKQPLCITECCHIFPESTNCDIDDKSTVEYAADVWTIIERFGYPELRAELEGEEIHSLKNIDTRHRTNNPNMVFIGYGFPREVQFKTIDERFDLPDSRLLKLHATCCKVAWMSGAAGYMNELDRKRDDYNPYEHVPADTLFALLSGLPTAPVDKALNQLIETLSCHSDEQHLYLV